MAMFVYIQRNNIDRYQNKLTDTQHLTSRVEATACHVSFTADDTEAENRSRLQERQETAHTAHESTGATTLCRVRLQHSN